MILKISKDLKEFELTPEQAKQHEFDDNIIL